MTTNFLNADLILQSRHDLSSLENAWGEDMVMLSCHQQDECYQATFELGEDALREHTPEVVIQRLCTLLEALQPPYRDLFQHAEKRVVDVGFETPRQNANFTNIISVSTLSRLVQLNTELAMIVYPYRE